MLGLLGSASLIRGPANPSPHQGLSGAWQGLPPAWLNSLSPPGTLGGEPCQELVPVGLSAPWKPSHCVGSSRSQPMLFTEHWLRHRRGNWQRLPLLLMNLLPGLSRQHFPGKAIPHFPPWEYYTGEEAQAEQSAGSNPRPLVPVLVLYDPGHCPQPL